jgi:endonuclease YncB( thermonuclease family)
MRVLRLLVTLILLGLIVFAVYQWLIVPFTKKDAVLIHLIDPDTLIVKEDGKLKLVQLIGIDAPELTGPSKGHQCYDLRAKRVAAMKYFSDNRVIYLSKDDKIGDKDIYNRDLRYVRLADGSMLNINLLQDGLAKIYDPPGNPEFKFIKDFYKAQGEAQQKKLGIWNDNICDGKF